jgi:hypothetical protein
MSEFDEVLERVLMEVTGEPRLGIERRVMARVIAAGKTRRVWWMAAWSCAAVACFVALLFWSRNAPHSLEQGVVNSIQPAITGRDVGGHEL